MSAPIFDNGDALFSNFGKFDGQSIEENLEKVFARPFSASHLRQAMDAGIGIQLDYGRLYGLLDQVQKSGALDVLYFQLDRMRDIIPAMKD